MFACLGPCLVAVGSVAVGPHCCMAEWVGVVQQLLWVVITLEAILWMGLDLVVMVGVVVSVADNSHLWVFSSVVIVLYLKMTLGSEHLSWVDVLSPK